MSIQPTLTPEQQAQLCPTCAHGGTSRYCIPGGTCYCQHEACPAYPTSLQRRDPWGNVVGLESRVPQVNCETIGGPGNRTAPAGNRGLTPSDATGKG